MKIDITLAAIIAGTSILVTWWLANRKRSHELLDSKRKAAGEFLAKVNECLFDAKEAGNAGLQCVCQKSYAAFRLTLHGKEATDLEVCWNDYISKQHRGERCIECLECLHELVHAYTATVGSRSVPSCSVCSGPPRLVPARKNSDKPSTQGW